MGHMDGGTCMAWMWLGGAVFWGSLIAFGIWAVRRFTTHRAADGARGVLEQRFARGEIDADEFESRLRTLER